MDPTQAIALSRISLIMRWLRVKGDSLASTYALRADAATRGLAPRESLLVHATALFVKLNARFADPDYWSHRADLAATLKLGTEQYPDDPELWYALAETQYHFGEPLRRTLDSFDRVIALDSAFVPSYSDAIVTAMALGGPEAARRYLAAYLAQPIGDARADGTRIAARLMYEGEASRRETESILDSSSADVVDAAMSILGYWPDSAETVVQLGRVFRAGRPTGVSAFADSSYTGARLARMLEFRGHLHEALAALPGSPAIRVAGVSGSEYQHGLNVATAVLLGGAPVGDASLFFGRLASGPIERPTGAILALPWWSERRDTASLQRVIRQAGESMRGASAVESRYVQYVADAAKAYLALARADSAGALSRLLALPNSGCMYPYCPFEGLVAAELLASRGDHARAALILDDVPNLYSPIAVLWRFKRAREAEALGRTEVAVAEYRYVADVWARADPVLQPTVAAARAALKRLGASRNAR